MKEVERREARRLRRDGQSIKAIAARLAVSPSSVSIWTRDITLSEEQQARLMRRFPGARQAATLARRKKAREARLAAQDHGRDLAREGEPLHQRGCMLFWGEGSKSRNTVIFTNSDPHMMVEFVRFLRRSYGVGDESFTLTVNCFLGNGHTLDEIEAWWLDRLDLPRSCLRTATVNRPSRASQFRRKTLVYATARVCVHSTFIVQSIYGAIQEYAGFEGRNGWIDSPPVGDVVLVFRGRLPAVVAANENERGAPTDRARVVSPNAGQPGTRDRKCFVRCATYRRSKTMRDRRTMRHHG